MTNIEDICGKAMASMIALTDDEGQSIADRISVGDLWAIVNHIVPIVQDNLLPDPRLALTPNERKIFSSRTVLEALKNGQKIVAIKEAREITGMTLKDAKDAVEKLEAHLKLHGGTT